MSSPTSPFEAISEELDDSPAAPRSWSEASRSRSSSSRQHSTSFDSSNGSPICTVGRFDSSSSDSSALARTEAPPMPSRPVRAPSSTSWLPIARRRAPDQPLARRQPDAHRVHEAVLLVGRLEVDLAADGRHADRVAVVADALDGPVEQVARARRVELAEAERVEHGDRPRAHREDVAQDAADAGGGALERLDRARVVVRLDLERRGQPVAHVHDARVLARAPSGCAGPRSAACAGASSSACRRSAPTTSARTRPARARSARGPRRSQMPSYSASVRPSSR